MLMKITISKSTDMKLLLCITYHVTMDWVEWGFSDDLELPSNTSRSAAHIGYQSVMKVSGGAPIPETNNFDASRFPPKPLSQKYNNLLVKL